MSLTPSVLLPAIEVKASERMDQISGVSTFIANCEVNYYKLTLNNEKPLGAATDRNEIPLLPLGEKHILIEFPFVCNVFGKDETIYAMIGQYKNRISEKTTAAAIYDDGEGGKRYMSLSEIKAKVLRLAQNETGQYFRDDQIDEAMLKLLRVTENVPHILGISLPAKATGISLPAALVLLAFAFYHRTRRIVDNNETVWVMMHANGALENGVSILWKAVLLLAPAVVYLTASLYLSPSPELRGAVEMIGEQRASTTATSITSKEVWLSGIENSHVILLCSLSLALCLFGLISIRKVANERKKKCIIER